MANYNTTLQANNTDLQSILATINSLPEAGSGGSGGSTVETCTVTLSVPDDVIIGYAIYFNGNLYSLSINAKRAINSFGDVVNSIQNVLKNSLIAIYCPNGYETYGVDGNANTPLMVSGYMIPIYITGDCTITITDN